MTDVLTIHVEQGPSGLYFTTCDQHRGLLLANGTLAEALRAVVPTLKDLLAAGPPHPDPAAFEGLRLD